MMKLPLRRVAATWLMCLVALVAVLASPQARAAVSVSAPPAGLLAGDEFTLSFSDDSLVDFEFGDLQVIFDPITLSLLGAASTPLTQNFSVLAGSNPQPYGQGLVSVPISMITGGAGITGSGAILDVFFRVNQGAAPGLTPVVFDQTDPDVYEFAAVTVNVGIDAPGTVPAPSPIALLLLALLMLARVARQRVA